MKCTQSQANTFNHPADILYLKRKETSYTTAFDEGFQNASACTSLSKNHRNISAPELIRTLQSRVGLAHQRRPQPHPDRPRHRDTTAEEALAALVSPARPGTGPVGSFQVSISTTLGRGPFLKASLPPFTREEGRKQFPNHFDSS